MDKRHKCPHCSGTFKNKKYLRPHLLTHTGVKAHSCSKCSKTFTQKGALGIHIRRVHQKIKTHKCTVCTLTFSSLNELKVHSGIHETNKRYKCTMCLESFVQKGALVKHINSIKHSGKGLYFNLAYKSVLQTRENLPIVLRATYSKSQVALTKC